MGAGAARAAAARGAAAAARAATARARTVAERASAARASAARTAAARAGATRRAAARGAAARGLPAAGALHRAACVCLATGARAGGLARAVGELLEGGDAVVNVRLISKRAPARGTRARKGGTRTHTRCVCARVLRESRACIGTVSGTTTGEPCCKLLDGHVVGKRLRDGAGFCHEFPVCAHALG
jgi:hypothetical protein